jgi:transposase-like protein
MPEERQCVLVIVGADEYGRKELLAMIDGFRESAESWRELLLDLRRRGLKQDPKLAIGDGALGFWTALREVFATTREQRCWLHKTMNVLNALPKSLQDKAKSHLHDIWAGRKQRPRPVPPSTFSSKPTGSNTTRPWPSWSRIARRC